MPARPVIITTNYLTIPRWLTKNLEDFKAFVYMVKV